MLFRIRIIKYVFKEFSKIDEKEKFEETYVLISITFYTMDYDG